MARQIAASLSFLQSAKARCSLSLSLNRSNQQAPSNQLQQPVRRATTSPANNNQHERQLRRATGETAAHQQQRQQHTSEILASPFLSSPTKFEFKDGSQ
ncbi:hypothetical protein KY290_018055 [Solanum tuberosum]|uniref:Uncharacterized protein n=1 Tax=Solanum tuberosum TaxID=4113 RepID=A0ABQ7VD39_SOLTU|nr:hypothetical protein KY285_017020 [Solanum tuberosum]KAH0761982.1 hypothetical protein KY290_018055 [Solanum tuberosum]